MSYGGGKGRGFDWKATAEMLSSKSTACQSRDGETDSHKDADAVEVILTTSPEDLPSPVDLPNPARQEVTKKFEVINLKYDPEKMKVVKANRLSFSSSRPAPPLPYRRIAPKPKQEMEFSDTSYEVAEDGNDMEMTDFNEVDELKERWHAIIERSLTRMRTADSASLRALSSTPEPELDYVSLERWECHGCSLFHPIEIDGCGWEWQDPNVCNCCNHDRCDECWDLDDNGWRVQFCDGSPLEHWLIG